MGERQVSVQSLESGARAVEVHAMRLASRRQQRSLLTAGRAAGLSQLVRAYGLSSCARFGASFLRGWQAGRCHLVVSAHTRCSAGPATHSSVLLHSAIMHRARLRCHGATRVQRAAQAACVVMCGACGVKPPCR
jgi:hypothetical protein